MTDVETLRKERDAWKAACARAGVCMSCAVQMPDPHGCFDCQGTGWDGGAPVEAREAAASLTRQTEKVEELERRVAEYEALIGSPHVDEWFEAVRIEAAHQVDRWGSAQDAGKTPLDWFWLIGFLAQKAVHASQSGDAFKAKHHTISTGAALLNWFRRMNSDKSIDSIAARRARSALEPPCPGK